MQNIYDIIKQRVTAKNNILNFKKENNIHSTQDEMK